MVRILECPEDGFAIFNCERDHLAVEPERRRERTASAVRDPYPVGPRLLDAGVVAS